MSHNIPSIAFEARIHLFILPPGAYLFAPDVSDSQAACFVRLARAAAQYVAMGQKENEGLLWVQEPAQATTR